MTIDIDELERVGNAATSPEWDSVSDSQNPDRSFVVLRTKRNGFYPTVFDDYRTALTVDADFVSVARNSWPAIIAELREAERLRKSVKLLHDATIVLRNGMGDHVRRSAACDEARRLIELAGVSGEGGK